MTEYDGQDQAYQDLLEECEQLRTMLTEICELIHYQAALKHQDRWLQHCIKLGLYTIEEDE